MQFTEFGEHGLTAQDLQAMLGQGSAKEDDSICEADILDQNTPFEVRPNYLPHFHQPRPSKMPGIVAILDSKTRVYLQPEQRTLAYDNAHDNTSSSRSAYVPHSGELDLGIEPLQQIVIKMRRLQSEAQNAVVDRHVARRGVMAYCPYLVGDHPPPRARRRLTSRVKTTKPFK